MPFSDAVRRLLGARSRRSAATPDSRRAFFRRMGGASIAALAGGGLLADEAWAAVEERANRFGIVPGTRVDAQGRPVRGAVMGPEEYLGEIFMFCSNFAPRGSLLCQGQVLPIAQNTALFSLLGTTFGGNGQTTFALPDFRGRVPMQQGEGPGLTPRTLGEAAGSEVTTLTPNQMPMHTHGLLVSDAPGTTPSPTNGFIAAPASSIPAFVPSSPTGTLNPQAVSAAGGSQPFDTMQPFLAVNFCIVTEGIFPSRP